MCHNAEEVIADIGYDPEKDLENTADSVFCAHGAGFVVPWTQAEEHMHIQSVFPAPARTADREVAAFEKRPAAAAGTLEEDKELMAIFERTYGPVPVSYTHLDPPDSAPAPPASESQSGQFAADQRKYLRSKDQ